MANDLGFIEGNVVKYVTRWKHKGGLQDLEKAQHYLDFLIEKVRRARQDAAGGVVIVPPAMNYPASMYAASAAKLSEYR
jgi:hypothetical protein